MRRETLFGLLTTAVLALSVAACERIPRICEDQCKQQKACDPTFEDWYTIYQCRADCEDSLEQYVEDQTDSCRDAYLDYYECTANLSCDELNTHDYSSCDDESLRMSEVCETDYDY